MSGPKHDPGILSPSEKLARASERDRATIQRLAAALKRCDSEAVWDDLVDMWLVSNEVMDEIRAALREAGVKP